MHGHVGVPRQAAPAHPTDQELELFAKVVDSAGDRATVEARLEAAGKVTATCRGVFVAVKEGHPAFHRW